MDAGVEILLHPEMAHAKVLRIDEQVLIGGCNLDDLSLFRNDELDLLFADPAIAELTERSIFDELQCDVHPGDRDHGRQAASLERRDGPRVPFPVVAVRRRGAYLSATTNRSHGMSIGPVEYIAIAFPGNKFSGQDRSRHQGAPAIRDHPGPRPGHHQQGRRRQRHRPSSLPRRARKSRRRWRRSASRAGTCSGRRTSRTSAPRSIRTRPPA